MSDSESQPGMITGRGCASKRFADALLRSCGATQITLRIANPATGDTGSQIGLEAPPSQDVQISPAVITSLPPAADGGRRIKVTLSGTAVEGLAKSCQVVDICGWLLTAEGVVMHDRLLHIDSVTVDCVLGSDCLYHLTAAE